MLSAQFVTEIAGVTWNKPDSLVDYVTITKYGTLLIITVHTCVYLGNIYASMILDRNAS